MSIHRSLRTVSSALNQHRNVLKRSERITLMTERESFDPRHDSPMGLVKYANRKAATGKKPKKAAEGEVAEGVAAAAPAAAGKEAAKPAAKGGKK